MNYKEIIEKIKYDIRVLYCKAKSLEETEDTGSGAIADGSIDPLKLNSTIAGSGIVRDVNTGVLSVDPALNTDDQNGSEVEITPAGNITSTNVQDAIEELDNSISNFTAVGSGAATSPESTIQFTGTTANSLFENLGFDVSDNAITEEKLSERVRTRLGSEVYVKTFGQDYAAINAAIATLQDGDTIVFDGEYIIDNPQGIAIENLNNITVDGSNAVFNSTDISYAQRLHNQPMMWVNNVNDSVIKGFTFDGAVTQRPNQVGAMSVESCENLILENNVSQNMTGTASFVEGGCSRNTWKNNTARNSQLGGGGSNGTRGFWLGNGGAANQHTSNITVIDNFAYNNNATGIVLFSDGGKASNNYCYDNDGSGLITGGSDNAQVQEITISGNYLRGNVMYGYQDDSVTSSDVDKLNTILVTDNIILENGQGGILLVDSANNLITDNLIKNNNDNGINVTNKVVNAYIVNNTIVDDQTTPTQTNGIKINASNYEISNLKVSGNNIKGSVHGISLNTVNATSTLNNVEISNNTLKNNTYGIFSANNGSVNNIRIVTNNFENNTTRDVRLTGYSTSTGVVFENNEWDKDRSQFDIVENVYSSDWNSSTDYATKNALYDKIESLGTGAANPFTKVGTMANNQVVVATGDGSLKTSNNLQFNDNTIIVNSPTSDKLRLTGSANPRIDFWGNGSAGLVVARDNGARRVTYETSGYNGTDETWDLVFNEFGGRIQRWNTNAITSLKPHIFSAGATVTGNITATGNIGGNISNATITDPNSNFVATTVGGALDEISNRISGKTAPTSSADAGVAGEIRVSGNEIFWYTGTQWVKSVGVAF